MRTRGVLAGLALVGLVMHGVAGSAMGFEYLLNANCGTQGPPTPPPPGWPPCSVIQWVVEDGVEPDTAPHLHYLIAGTGFNPNPPTEYIVDNRAGNTTWTTRAQANVGESLYVVLHPRELQPQYRRGIFFASENTGQFGYYDAGAIPPAVGIVGDTRGRGSPPGATNPGQDNLCGTSIGYRPDLQTVYFGFVHCNRLNLDTYIHTYQLPFGPTTYNVGLIRGRTVHGPWILINGRLYNTAAAERAQPPDVQVIRQDGPNSYPPVGTYRVDVGSGAFWSHARFLGIGFYWSELDLVGNGAKPYAVNVIDGFRTQLFHMGMPITASAFTFLEDTFRGQLFTFASFSGGGIAVGCTTNGWSVNAVEPLQYIPGHGLTGSVATVWQKSPMSVVWGHGGKTPPTRAIIARTYGSCVP